MRKTGVLAAMTALLAVSQFVAGAEPRRPIDVPGLFVAVRGALQCLPTEGLGSTIRDYAMPEEEVSDVRPADVVAEVVGETDLEAADFRESRRGRGFRVYTRREDGRAVRVVSVVRDPYREWAVVHDKYCV